MTWVTKPTQFLKALAHLRKSGGTAAAAAQTVENILGRVSLDPTAARDGFGTLTKHGETRIKGAVKYDLGAGYRLVTQHTPAGILFLYVGSHDDCERWLERHRGITFVVDQSSRKITPVFQLDAELAAPLPDPARVALPDPAAALLELLGADHLNRLPQLPLHASRLLFMLSATSDDGEIEAAVSAIPSLDDRNLFLDVLVSLRAGDCEGAVARLDLHDGRALGHMDPAANLAEAISAEVNSDTVIDLGSLEQNELKRVLRCEDFHEWLVFLHPDQRRLVEEQVDTPILLRGVSGSGKTSVLIHRARWLAKRHPDSTILVVALNPALCSLLESLVGLLCAEEPSVCSRIQVRSIGSLSESIVRHFRRVRLPCDGALPHQAQRGTASRELRCNGLWGRGIRIA